MSKIYAVKKGRKPGIYNTWEECKENVHGFPSAEFKSFRTKAEAKAWIEMQSKTLGSKSRAYTRVDRNIGAEIGAETTADTTADANAYAETAYAFCDGSYNPETRVYGFGGYVVDDEGNKHIIQGHNDDPAYAAMRNVAGEIDGALAAVKKAIDLGMDEIIIYYDYKGIEAWATGQWQTKKAETKKYAKTMNAYRKEIKISYQHVKGHSGIEGNEEADRLAKEAVGI